MRPGKAEAAKLSTIARNQGLPSCCTHVTHRCHLIGSSPGALPIANDLQ
jgi:hypothetical protein